SAFDPNASGVLRQGLVGESVVDILHEVGQGGRGVIDRDAGVVIQFDLRPRSRAVGGIGESDLYGAIRSGIVQGRDGAADSRGRAVVRDADQAGRRIPVKRQSDSGVLGQGWIGSGVLDGLHKAVEGRYQVTIVVEQDGG